MKYEREGLLLSKQTEQQPDQTLLESFEAAHLGAAEIYSDLALPADRKDDVLHRLHNGEDADMSAVQLDPNVLSERMSSLLDWKKSLIHDDSLDAETKQLYRWKVNEDIANVKLLIASSQGDTKTFKQMNEFIYGKPDEDLYRGALDWVAHDAEKLLAKPAVAENVQAAAKVVLDALASKRGYREILVPDPELFENVRQDHMRPMGYYGLLLAGVVIPEGKINNEVGDPILKRVVHDNLDSDYDIIDAKAASWSVSHSKSAVERPATYNMVTKRFVGLGLGHEIGSHLLERQNGERGPIALLKNGFDRTERGNEGRAVIREQVPYDTFDEFGNTVRWRDILRRDISIGFANGVGKETPRSSAETYAFMNMIDYMYQIKLSPDDPETAHTKADSKTDSLILRVLKGTNGKGGAYLKDKVYLEGNVSGYLTASLRGVGAISEGDLGKFDISNDRHLTPLRVKGLIS